MDHDARFDAPVRRRRLLAGLGGASVLGLAGTLRTPASAGALVTWSNFTPALKLKQVQTAGKPDVPGVTTTAQWREDTNAGLVYIQFLCAFTSSYTAPNNDNLWGFADVTTYGLPAPSTAVNNVIGGSVSSHPANLAIAILPGKHMLLVAGFSGKEVLFAHGSTAPGVTRSYLNRNSPYTWAYDPADPSTLATVKGTIFYRRA